MILLEGKVSVKSALLNEKRHMETIYIDDRKNDKDTAFIKRIAKEKGIAVENLSREEIDRLAKGKTHGGILAMVSERKAEDLKTLLQEDKNLFLVLVEGVEDPYNLGYVMRALACSGCDGLILPRRDWSQAESQIMKASAGAFDALPLAFEETETAIRLCKERGLQIYASMRKDAVSLYETDLTQPMLICVGGEMRGLSKQVLDAADKNVYIPYDSDFRNALNASSAVSVIAFETLRQRKYNNF